MSEKNVSEKVLEANRETTQKTTQKTTQSLSDIQVAILETQSDPEVIQSDSNIIKLIELIKSNPSISRAELARRLGISERQTRKIIDKLRADGILLRKGADYKGEWIILG